TPAAAPVQVKAAVAAPVAAAPALRVLATSPSLVSDEDEAWRELAQSWKLPLAPGAEPCAALAREQVHCFTKTLNLSLIRQLARPGIVTLDAQSGKPSYAILAAVTDQTATLRAAGTEQTVTLAALAQRWQGEFSTLWRAPEGYRGDRVNDGGGGPGIDWVALQLAAVKGVEPPSGKSVLDTALKAQVRSFQLAQGLPADGRPGPLTFMQLNRATGVQEPRLRTEP
ncbi:MAG: Peptidoglycan-binding domain 1, partial [Ramlibacter sp.]|nr:Peptidoglycan-binding domain 1 [Ramlibacter sp.]